MAVTLGGTAITFNDSTTQSTAAGPGTMQIISEVANSGSTNSFSVSIPSPTTWNEFILVWQANQFSGPAGSTLTLTESTTGALYSSSTAGSLIVSSTGANNVTQVSVSAGATNFLASFSGGSVFYKGRVVITRIKNSDSTTSSRYHVSVHGGSSGGLFLGEFTAGGTVGATAFFISTITFGFSQSNNIHYRLYGIRA
jgi:hypothetical protein